MCIQAFVWNNIRCFCSLCTCNVLNIFQNVYYGFLQICTYNLSKKQNYKEIYFMNDYFYDYKKVIFEVLWIIFEKLIRFWIWRCREEREWVVFMWKRLPCLYIRSANNMLAHMVACYSIIQLWLLDNLNLKFKHEWLMALLT